QVVADGDLTPKQRNDVLASMTDEVAALVLKSNYRSNIALANAPSPRAARFPRRKAEGRGLTAPELAVLQAYTKIVLEDDLLKGSLPDDEYLSAKLASYFPPPIQEKFAGPMQHHQLRREIIVTQVVNEFVNTSGITAFHRLSLETGGTREDGVRANL